MAVEVNLEKYKVRKKGFIGFSWTAFFFNFFVPLFRGDFKWLLIFLFPFIFIYLGNILNLDFDNNYILIIFVIPVFIVRFIFPFFYNHFYTKDLLKKGYLPPEDDDYSNAILKGNKNIRSHLKSPLNIGTKKPKKNEVQLKPKNPFFLCPYFSKFTSIAIIYLL